MVTAGFRQTTKCIVTLCIVLIFAPCLSSERARGDISLVEQPLPQQQQQHEPQQQQQLEPQQQQQQHEPQQQEKQKQQQQQQNETEQQQQHHEPKQQQQQQQQQHEPQQQQQQQQHETEQQQHEPQQQQHEPQQQQQHEPQQHEPQQQQEQQQHHEPQQQQQETEQQQHHEPQQQQHQKQTNAPYLSSERERSDNNLVEQPSLQYQKSNSIGLSCCLGCQYLSEHDNPYIHRLFGLYRQHSRQQRNNTNAMKINETDNSILLVFTSVVIASNIPVECLCVVSVFVVLVFVVLVFVVFSKNAAKRTSPDDLVNSGNRHKLNQQWQEAADSFKQAAEIYSKQKRRGEHDAANNFAEAANCYRKLKHPEFIQKAVQCLKTASQIYAEVGQFSIAARQLEEAGDLFARSKNSGNDAIELYLKAADYWGGEDSPASAAGSRSKAAHLMADIERFADAAKEFEDLGVSSQQHSLLGFGASEYMFKACLCQMCLDPLSCAEMAEDLSRKCDSFTGSDEKSLVMKLSDACEAGDVSAFDKAVAEFERMNNLDDWSRKRLEQVRKRLAGESPGLT